MHKMILSRFLLLLLAGLPQVMSADAAADLKKAKDAADQAEKNFKKADDDFKKADSSIKDAENKAKDVDDDVKDADKDVKDAENKLKDLEKKLKDNKSSDSLKKDIDKQKKEINDKKKKLDAAKKAQSDAKKKLDDAKKKQKDAAKKRDDAQKKYDDAKKKISDAQKKADAAAKSATQKTTTKPTVPKTSTVKTPPTKPATVPAVTTTPSTPVVTASQQPVVPSTTPTTTAKQKQPKTKKPSEELSSGDATFYSKLQQSIATNQGVLRLSDIMPDSFDSILKLAPNSLAKGLKATSMQNATILPSAPMAEKGANAFTVSGTVVVGSISFKLNVYYTGKGVVFELKPMGAVKLADIDQGLAVFDQLGSIDPSIVLSLANYIDPVSHVIFKSKTCSIVGYTTLNVQLLKDVGTFVSSLNQAFVLGDLNKLIVTIQVKTTDVKTSTLEISLPIKMSLDFDALASQGKLEMVSELIKRVELSEFKLVFGGQDTFVSGTCGMLVYLASQKSPLEFKGILGFSPTSVTVGAAMDQSYKSAFGLSWLTLTDVGAELIFMPTSPLVVLGIPLGGLAMRGALTLGTTTKRTVQIATKISLPSDLTKAAAGAAEAAQKKSLSAALSSTGTSIGVYGTADRLDLADIWYLFMLMVQDAGKSISWPDMPVLYFTDVEVRVMPTSVMIVDKRYAKGTAFKGSWNFLGQKGSVNFLLQTEPLPKLQASGFIDPIDTPYFKLTSAGNENRGPHLEINASLTSQPAAILSANLEVPLLALQRKVDFKLTKSGLFATFKTNIFNFEADKVDVSIPTTGIKDASIAMTFGTTSLSELEKTIASALTSASDDIGDIIVGVINIFSKVFDVKINKFYGRISGADLAAGKEPLVTISFSITVAGISHTVELKDLQFDFKNPINSSADIAKKILDAIF